MDTRNPNNPGAASRLLVSNTKLSLTLTLEGPMADVLAQWAEENTVLSRKFLGDNPKAVARELRAEQRRMASMLLTEAMAACMAVGGPSSGFIRDPAVSVKRAIAPRLEVSSEIPRRAEQIDEECPDGQTSTAQAKLANYLRERRN